MYITIAAIFSLIDLLVLPLGVTRHFVCTSSHGIVWLVNGTSAASAQLPEWIVLGEEVQLENGGIQRNLTFTADARINNIHIRCIVSNFEGQSYISLDVNLTIQGNLVIISYFNCTINIYDLSSQVIYLLLM